MVSGTNRQRETISSCTILMKGDWNGRSKKNKDKSPNGDQQKNRGKGVQQCV